MDRNNDIFDVKTRRACLIMEVQSSLHGLNRALICMWLVRLRQFDVCQVGRTIETTFESVATYFVESFSTFKSRRTVYII